MKRRWLKIYLFASLLALLSIAGAESYWRHLGYRATVIDDKNLWSTERWRIDDSPQTLAVLGASRIQLGFNAQAFSTLYPEWKLANLSVNAHYPVATLVDLANHTPFRGVALVAMDAHAAFAIYQNMQQPWVDYFHRDFGPGLAVHALLSARWQEHVATANPDLSFNGRVANWLGDSRKPPLTYVTFDHQRFGHADYRQIDAGYHRRYRVEEMTQFYQDYPMPSPDDWLAGTEPLLRAIRTIQSRGGQVVLLRMPTSGEYWQLDERYLPRHVYWDRLASQQGVTAVHFQDIPGMADYPLPDGSHLDFRDTAGFTRDLLLALQHRGLLPESP